MIDDCIKKSFPVAPLPASPPSLESTTPLDTPPDWQSPYFQSPPALIPQYYDVSSSSASLVSSIDESVTFNSFDSFSTSTLHIFNGSASSLEYLDQDSLETLNFNVENSLNPPESPFKLPVDFTSSPDVKSASPPLFFTLITYIFVES
ncbi:hypothetical protein O181_112564 [Austropuccinia psidii MF-1]|uniref:Uncharacterized protein n=1 Tax=Austropuccinia psidii MF-1 TaxID=1389203 RepID=A0A9Q3K214_9BASI|nr:hypothetical protein [Austropuccinia psidii MF-1]